MSSKNDQSLTVDELNILRSIANRGDIVAKAIMIMAADRIVVGGLVKAPTTASAQITGAGATSWRVNVDEVVALVDAVMKNLAAQVDVVIHSATQLLVNGQSAIAAVVLKVAANGTVSIVTVKGAAATTGAQVAPTNAAIQTAVGAGLSWLKLAETTLNRTADTTVTQTIDNSKRSIDLVMS